MISFDSDYMEIAFPNISIHSSDDKTTGQRRLTHSHKSKQKSRKGHDKK